MYNEEAIKIDFLDEQNEQLEPLENVNYRWLNEIGLQFLEKDYLLPGQTVDERINIICNKAQEILKIKGYAKKLKNYISKGYYTLSTPILSNFGTTRGMPISCFGLSVNDSMESILTAQAEMSMQTKLGGGTSGIFNLRPRGADIKDNGKSSGSVHFMNLFNSAINIISQGSLRRGSFSPWLRIDHEDIWEFLTLRSEGSPIQDLSFGVVIPEGWMQSMIDGNKEKRKLWARVLEVRANTGFPYIMFADNSNNNTVDVYKDKKMEITHSNLCSEIQLPDSEDESFVCDLSSMNALYFEEWKDTDAVETLVFLLDAVMTEFIERAKCVKFMERAVKFAERHRAIGVGIFGWHSFLQSKMIAFESIEAKAFNVKIAKYLKEKTYKASEKLAVLYGEPEILKGYGRRNTTLMAIAPTKSSAFIFGQASESCEPQQSNAYIKDLAKGKFTFKNPYLEKILIEKNKNTDEIWRSILSNRGSIQHLEFLSDHEKSVFKTFSEISQMEVIIQVAQRQRFIDQSQSTNLMIHPLTPVKDVNALIIEAWKLGVKTLYYSKSINAAQAFSRELLDCIACSA